MKNITGLTVIGLGFIQMTIVMTQTCNRKYENQMDAALARIIVFGEKGAQFPETATEMRAYCNQAQRLHDRVKRYSEKCLNPFGKNALSILLHTTYAEMKSVCKPGRVNKRAQSLLEAAKCGNQGLDDIFKHCYSPMVERLTHAVKVDAKLRIPICCCNFHQFLSCWENQVERINICTPKVRDFFVKWTNKMFEGILQIMCVQYDESNAECDRFLAITSPKNSTRKPYKSVFLPLVKIAMSLEWDE